MLMKKTIFIFLLFVTDSFSSFSQTTYYLNSISGNDNFSGKSERKAWKSLEKINAVTLKAGDKVLFSCGSNFVGMFNPKGSGEQGNPIIIDKFGNGAVPILSGNGLVEQTIYLYNNQYIEIKNLEITNYHSVRGKVRKGIFVMIEDFGVAHHILLQNLYIHDVNGSINHTKISGGILWYATGGKKPSRYDDFVIENCKIVRCDRDGIRGSSEVFVYKKKNWFPSTNVIIRNNVLEDIGGDGIVLICCDGALIEHNFLNGGRTHIRDYAAGIWPWACENVIVQYNEVCNMKGFKDGQGFDVDFNCKNIIVQYNYSHDNEGGFLLICTPSEKLDPDLWGSDNVIVRYNVSINDGERTFHVTGPVSNVKIHNNFIYLNKKQDHPIFLFTEWGEFPEKTWIANNIFYADGVARYSYAHEKNQENGTYFKTDGEYWRTKPIYKSNVYFGKHVLPPSDSSGVYSDPMIENLATIFNEDGEAKYGFEILKNLRINPKSPCLNNAFQVMDTVENDFLGKKIVGKYPKNIGIFE
jgi:Right handed beta helix region